MLGHAFARKRNTSSLLVLRRVTLTSISQNVHVRGLHATTHPPLITHNTQRSACCLPPGTHPDRFSVERKTRLAAVTVYVLQKLHNNSAIVRSPEGLHSGWMKRVLIPKGNKVSKHRRDASLKRKRTLIIKISPRLDVHNGPFLTRIRRSKLW